MGLTFCRVASCNVQRCSQVHVRQPRICTSIQQEPHHFLATLYSGTPQRGFLVCEPADIDISPIL